MPDRDDLDSWLDGRVDPLPPPPGTFELVQRRARRRKYRKLAITAGAAAAVVAAAVTIPQVVSLHLLSPSPASSRLAAGQSASPGPTGGGSPAASSAAPVTSPALAAPVPANFQPGSVTFVSTDTGWVIGQAGTPGHCATQYCTSMARTDDAGKAWAGVPAPLTGPPDGATGVGQIRFLNLQDGWAFGPDLFATHDGGEHWTAIDTHGLRVTDLETVGGRAFALFASCSGTGPAFAGQCTSFSLYSSLASADDWTPVGPPTSGLAQGGQDGAASIVLTGTTGYLLAPDGMLYAGPVDGSAPWQAVARVPCAVGPAQQDGQPTGALLAAASATRLVVACTPPPVPGGAQKKLIFASADGGASWQPIEPVTAGPAAVAPAAGTATSLAATSAGTVVLGTTQGIDVLAGTGTAWQQVALSGAPAGGFIFVGMTTAEQGVAVPADLAAGSVWFTFDAGQHWQPSSVSGS
jgi:hypothetical protein